MGVPNFAAAWVPNIGTYVCEGVEKGVEKGDHHQGEGSVCKGGCQGGERDRYKNEIT